MHWKRKAQKCSVCGESGHNRLSCPQNQISLRNDPEYPSAEKLKGQLEKQINGTENFDELVRLYSTLKDAIEIVKQKIREI